MGKSIVLDADPSPLAALLLGHIRGVCALLAPCQRGASAPSFDRFTHSRALRERAILHFVRNGSGAGQSPDVGVDPCTGLETFRTLS
jgi:hypothetical protein